jgi:hypothetical protein
MVLNHGNNFALTSREASNFIRNGTALLLGRNVRRLGCWLRRLRSASVPSSRYEASALKQEIKFSFYALSNSVLATSKHLTLWILPLILSLGYRSVLSEVWNCHWWHLLFRLLLLVSFLLTVIPRFTQSMTFVILLISSRIVLIYSNSPLYAFSSYDVPHLRRLPQRSTLAQARKFASTGLQMSSSCCTTITRNLGRRSC